MSAARPTSTNTDAASLHAVINAEPAQIMSNPVGRAVYVVLGFLCLGLGITGYIVPLLPGTVFLLLATYFFFKSSERMYNWVLNNRQFGHVIRAYRAGYGIPRRIKAYAVVLIVISMGISIAVATDSVAVRLLLVAIGVAVSTFILTRPTTETVLARS